MNLMNIAIVQTDVCWADAGASRKRLDEILQGIEEADVVVLPEMFTTGFCMDASGIAEPEDGETLQWMRAWAARLDCALVGSIPVRAGGRYYNRMFFVCPDGSFRYYDKRHLFTFGGEDKVFDKGTERVIVDFRGFRFLLLVCYDLRFPVWIRCRKDYDAVINVANWPSGRRMVWDVLLRARALENQCYVVGVNRVGADASGVYDGGSVIVGPYGKVIAACEDGKQQCVIGKIGREVQDNFRVRFPVLDDADDFEIGL